MCGRYTLIATSRVLAKLFDPQEPIGDWRGSYSIAPSSRVPIVREYLDDEGELHRVIDAAVWGLRPGWAKESGPKPINARLETAGAKPFFRGPFQNGRAVVPMTGYFEWVEERPKFKVPYYLHAGDDRVLSAAGLYTSREVEGGWEISCTIITTDGHDAAGEVHDRMPVFLTPELVGEWLTPGRIDAEEWTGWLGESAETVAKGLEVRQVDRKVNNTRTARYDDPTLIAPA